MILHILCLSVGLLSSALKAETSAPDALDTKRQMMTEAVQNVNELFDAMLHELNETTSMHHASCKRAEEREHELKTQLMSLEREAMQMHAIQAELAMAQRDLQNALENETTLKNKLNLVQQQAGKELTHMRDEFEAFKTRLETTTNNFDKVFW